MKLKRVLGLCLCGSALLLKAESGKFVNDNGFEELKTKWKINHVTTKKYPGGKLEQSENGRSGKCAKVVNTATSRLRFFTGIAFKAAYKDQVDVAVYAKGKGRFKFNFFPHGGNKYLGTIGSRMFKVDSDDWQKYDFTFEFKKEKFEKLEKFFVALEVYENSDLLFDDFEGEILKKKPEGQGIK